MRSGSASAHLQAAEFIYEVNLFPTLEYTFKHALTYEVAYDSLLQERRKALHARIVRAFEALYPDRLAEHVERAAYHAVRGEVWEHALRYSRQAGLKGVARSANREAVTFFEQALVRTEASSGKPEHARAGDRSATGYAAGAGSARRVRSDPEPSGRSRDDRQDDRRQAPARAHPGLDGVFVFLLARRSRSRHRYRTPRAASSARDLADTPLQVIATFYLAYPHQQRGDYRPAVEGLKRVVATLQGELISQRFGMAGYPAVLSRGLLAWCLGDLGAFAEGRIYADEAIALAEARNQPWSQGVAQTYLGHFYLGQGDLHTAITLLERCRALIERWELPRLSTFTASLLGAAYALSGRIAESFPLLEQAAAQLGAEGAGTEARIAIPLSEGYLMTGRHEEARRLAGLRSTARGNAGNADTKRRRCASLPRSPRASSHPTTQHSRVSAKHKRSRWNSKCARSRPVADSASASSC